MSSSDDQIIQSVDNIISAVEKLVGDIRVAPDIDEAAKNFALKRVGAVAKDLNQINRALFFNDFEEAVSDNSQNQTKVSENEAEVRAKITGEDGASINEMLSAWSQPVEVEDGLETLEEDQVLSPTEVPKKPRIIVSPVKRSVSEKEEHQDVKDNSSDHSEEVREQDYSIASSFQESMVSSLAQSETSFVGERLIEEEAVLEKTSLEETSLEEVAHDEPVEQEGSLSVESEKEAISQTDDLTLIKGIDHDVADLLATHGITSFLDIVEFKEADMLRLSEELSDPCCVARENWIEQAALLTKDCLTLYAQQAKPEEEQIIFDRLSLNKFYTIHPDVVAPSFDGVVAESVSSLTERLSSVDTQDDQDTVLNSDTSFEEEVEAPMAAESASFSSNAEDEPHEEVLDVEPVEAEAVFDAETLDEGGMEEPQEFTDALLAKKLALEAELATLKAQMASQVETDENLKTETSFRDFKEDDIEPQDVVSPEVEILSHVEGQNEIADVFSSDDEEETSNFSAQDDLGDGAIWHEEVTTGKDYVPPVVEDDFEAEEDNPHFSDPSSSNDYTNYEEKPVFQEQYVETPFSQQQRQDHFVSPDATFQNSQDRHFAEEQRGESFPQYGGDFSNQGHSFDEGSSVNEEPVVQEEAYTYNVDQLSEHAPLSHLEEMSTFPEQRAPFGEVRQPSFLEVPSSDGALHDQNLEVQGVGSVESQTRGIGENIPPSPKFSADHAEDRGLGQGSVSPINQAEYVDDISVPKSSVNSDPVLARADSMANVLGAHETVSDKVPEIKEKMNNGQTLGQYLASKAQNELGDAPLPGSEESDVETADLYDQSFDDGNGQLSTPPLPPQKEDLRELSLQDRSISLPPSPPHAPQINMSEMGGPAQLTSGMPRPPAPPIASGIKVPPSVSGDREEINEVENGRRHLPPHSEVQSHSHSQNHSQSQLYAQNQSPAPLEPHLHSQRHDRGQPPLNRDVLEQNALPPLPPQSLPQGQPPQTLPPQREFSKGPALSSMEDPSSKRGPVEGPTPPPFTDMPSPVGEGQAYADTQRIIAAKRRADLEKAMNRSDIPNGQAFMDTQQLMENGAPFELQQSSAQAGQLDEPPALPPEAARAAAAYPKGMQNPEMSYRGQKPQQQVSDETLPPFEGYTGEEAKPKPSGFTAKAKKFAESLQRSFVDKE